jgi:hypothetical protein
VLTNNINIKVILIINATDTTFILKETKTIKRHDDKNSEQIRKISAIM